MAASSKIQNSMELRNLYKDCNLPREVADAPSLEVLKERLDRALEQINEVKYAHTSLPKQGVCDWLIFEGVFQPKPFYDLVLIHITNDKALT